MVFKNKKEKLDKKKMLLDFSMLLLGTFLCTLAHNLFLFQQKTISGFTGLAFIVNNVFGINISLFLAISYAFILVLSLIFLGWDTTKKSIVGSILYPIILELTSYIKLDLSAIDPIVMILCGALIGGFGLGIVYKFGYSTGGSDVVNQLLSKLLKRPMGTSMLITNGIIIFCGFLAFGLPTVIYSIIVVWIMSFVIDKVMIGISESKKFTIITDSETEVKKFLLAGLSHGVTVVPVRGGYTGNEKKMIICVIPNKEYIVVKQGVLEIDPNALILVSDVYEVLGNR